MQDFVCAKCRSPCPFADLPSEEVRAWGSFIRSVSFIPYQMIFEQGDSQDGCYLVCEGTAILKTRAANGRRLALGIVGPGDILDVGSLLGQSRHELSAHAITAIRARYLARAACERLMQEPSLLTGRLLAILAKQVKYLQRHSQLLGARASVRERLAALLLELGHRCGQELASGGRGQRIALKLSCELLGEMLDSSRTTVDEELCELRRRGLITREAGRIVILSETGLQELAQSVF